jgi:hypothetical protein
VKLALSVLGEFLVYLLPLALVFIVQVALVQLQQAVLNDKGEGKLKIVPVLDGVGIDGANQQLFLKDEDLFRSVNRPEYTSLAITSQEASSAHCAADLQ